MDERTTEEGGLMHLGGFLDDLGFNLRDLLGDLGVDPVIIAAIARARVSPSYQNIMAVQQAFAARGATAPLPLMNYLWRIYDPSLGGPSPLPPGQYVQPATNYAPWILFGIGLWALGRRR